MRIPIKTKCLACGRVFNMLNEVDAEEWYFGHDCEDDTTQEDYVAVS